MQILEALEREVTLRIIQEDAETICSLIQSERDGIFAMGIIPYYALFVNSCQEYFKEEFLQVEDSLKIKDIRNHIKEYAGSYGKSKKLISLVDNLQNESFKSLLRFPFMGNWNIHYNLGIFFNNDGHIVGNSQQLANNLGIEDLTSPNLGEIQYKLGYQIGSFVSYICAESAKKIPRPNIYRPNIAVEIPYYFDLNTNKKSGLFVDNSDKNLNLFYLNLLCNLNYVKHILRPLFGNENFWMLRVEYIVNYYTYMALKRLKNYCENNRTNVELSHLNNLLESDLRVFDPRFRGCMMHYGLEGYGVVSLEHIEKPFFGIIENCFGINIDSYLNLLHAFSDKMINFLEDNFDFSEIKLERF